MILPAVGQSERIWRETSRTHGADVIVDHSAVEELGAVGDRPPRTQRVDVLLSVFHLGRRRENSMRDAETSNGRGVAVKMMSLADLADVIGDSAMVGDVQRVLDGVVVSFSQLKGLFVTQLRGEKKLIAHKYAGVVIQSCARWYGVI